MVKITLFDTEPGVYLYKQNQKIKTIMNSYHWEKIDFFNDKISLKNHEKSEQ